MQTITEFKLSHYAMPVDLIDYAYFAALSGYSVATLDWTNIDIRRTDCFFAFRTFYNYDFYVETSVKMNYCAIFRCNIQTIVIIDCLRLFYDFLRILYCKKVDATYFAEATSEHRDRLVFVLLKIIIIDCSRRYMIHICYGK